MKKILLGSLMPMALAVNAQTITGGSAEFGYVHGRIANTSEPVSGLNMPGIIANVNLDLDFRLGLKGQIQLSNQFFNENSDDTHHDIAPPNTNIVGFTLLKDTSFGSAGGFFGAGKTTADDGKIGYYFGAIGNTRAGIADLNIKAGYADIRVDEDLEGFTGGFMEASAVFPINAKTSLMPYIGYGKASKGFNSSSGAGNYKQMGVKVSFQHTATNYIVAGFDYAKVTNTDYNEKANDRRFSLTYVIPFGQTKTTASTALNANALPVMPFRAAAWGEILD